MTMYILHDLPLQDPTGIDKAAKSDVRLRQDAKIRFGCHSLPQSSPQHCTLLSCTERIRFVNPLQSSGLSCVSCICAAHHALLNVSLAWE